MNAASLIFIALAGINSCIGNVLLKYSRMQAAPDASALEKLLSPYFLGGLFFYAVNVVLFAKALDKAPVSVAYPILATIGFCLLALVSSYLFKEQLGVSQWLGLALAVAGIFLLARPA